MMSSSIPSSSSSSSVVLPSSAVGTDERCAVIQAVTHRTTLPALLSFLRATCVDALQQESWVSRESVLIATTADRRQRAVTLREECVEPVRSSTESPGLQLPLLPPPDDEETGGQRPGMRTLVYEERDTRSSTEVLIRRRIATPVVGEEPGGEGLETFLLFQGCVKRSSGLAKRGLRCQFTPGVRLTVFTIEEDDGFPLGGGATGGGEEGDLLLVELEAPVEGQGSSVLGSIEAVRDAAAVLQDFIVVRRRK